MFGEIYDASESLCGSYTGTKSGGPFLLDSVLDYPLYFIVNSVFTTAGGATRQMKATMPAWRPITTPTPRCGSSRFSTTTTSRGF